MVEYLGKELQSRLEIEDMKDINWEVTKILQSQEKFIEFHKWLKENGVKYDSVEYPVAFGKGGHLLGIAAKRDIGPEEAYIYIPNKLTINDDKIDKSEIGFIIKNHKDVFEEHEDGEYLRLIFFITYELSKKEKSFWYPYFKIAQESDLPCFWSEEELNELEDELLKAEVKEYQEEYDSEYQCLYEIAALYPSLLTLEEFTKERFKLAFTITVTRCFGWSLPHTMVVPFADCANHFIIDNQYEMHNRELNLKKIKIEKEGKSVEQEFSKTEQTYFTQCKMRVNCLKHFEGEESFDNKVEVPYKTKRYVKKLQMREFCQSLSARAFAYDPQFEKQNIWDLKYISTSDDEDNDSEESESESEEEEDESDDDKEKNKGKEEVPRLVDQLKTQKADESSSEDEELKENSANNKITPDNKIWKNESPGKDNNIPLLAKKLRPAKKKQRIYYAYTYDNQTGEGQGDPKKSVVVRKRIERRQPEDLIDILIMQKSYLYEKEQKMRLLKDQDEEEWQKMTEEYNSSEDDEDEENFAWYDDDDKNTYFTLCTKYKNTYEKGQQIFHCYGRRTNRFLLLNYGFCLNNNKYNSLSFRVWLNFNWQKEKEEEEKKTKTGLGEADIKEEEEQKDDKISKVIRLKRNRINQEIFAYLRANLLNTYKGKNLEHLLVSAPVDSEFEMLVVACTINLLTGLLTSRFKTPLEQDQEFLKDPNLPIRKRFAVLHRMNAKDILTQNIKYCNILMRILARFNDGKDFKRSYMGLVEGYETEEEIMENRIKVRQYLRELIVNQKRILEASKDQGVIDSIQKVLDDKKKQYQVEEKKEEQEESEEEASEYESEDDENDEITEKEPVKQEEKIEAQGEPENK